MTDTGTLKTDTITSSIITTDQGYWVLDIEGNGFIENITAIWCIVCRNIHTDETKVFLRPDLHPEEFLSFSQNVRLFIWHNGIKYDWLVLTKFGLSANISLSNTLDSLVFSRLVHQSRPGGHSLEAWGERFGIQKKPIQDFTMYTPEILERCIGDTLINKLLYNYLSKYLKDFASALEVEQWIEYYCYHQITLNGFKIDTEKLYSLHSSLSQTVSALTDKLREVFPPRSKFVREITPKLTQHGTLHAKDFRWLRNSADEQWSGISDNRLDLSPYDAGASFSRFSWEVFNPGSPQQVVRVLNEAGWKPVNKTDGYKDLEKEGPPKNHKEREAYTTKLDYFRTYGWSIDEDNLATVPSDAPEAIRVLVRWRMLQSRVSKMEEWIKALRDSDTIHPTIIGIGTVTHRCAHVNPNVGNIPSVAPKYDPKGPIYPEASELGKQLRSMWIARPGRVLVGTDADSIQLRGLAHYMDDARFTEALIKGRKEDGTDAHSLNKEALGPVCSTRDVAKTFIYAWLLGAGVGKVAQILNCGKSAAREAIEQFIRHYPGLRRVKEETIPFDARHGFFKGFDGRKVIPKGSDFDQRVYYMLSGYLQNGEALIMKHATPIWMKAAWEQDIPFWWVNFVHDEWQTETIDDGGLKRNAKGTWEAAEGCYAYRLGALQSDAIRLVGVQFSLRCPLAGQSKFGYNWLETH